MKQLATALMLVLSSALVSCTAMHSANNTTQIKNPTNSTNTRQADIKTQAPKTANPAAKPAQSVKIACVGDSITFGARLKHRQTECFPFLLGKLLGPKYKVKNFGLGGHMVRIGVRTSYNKPTIIKRVNDFQPDIIIIMLGTNDACQNNHQWVSRQRFVHDYKDLISKFRPAGSHAKIYLCLPVPAYPGDIGRRETVHPSILVPAVKQVAHETKCKVIDLYSPLNHKRKLFPDKIHPNAVGHQLIAVELYKTLTNKGASLTGDWAIPKDKNKFHIFVLMGQSNMAGFRNGTVTLQDRIPAAHVLYLPTINNTKPLQWKPASHPINNRPYYPNRFGLALPFAQKYVRDHQGITIGLISCAQGGAPISILNKGTAVYKNSLKKIAFAKKYGVIKGILWHQGESDTVRLKLAASYGANLHKLIKDLRTDISQPNLPFIAGNLAEFYGTGKEHNAQQRVKQINMVKTALRNLPKEIKNTAFVETYGLKSVDNSMVHFNRQSYIILGQRYAAAFEKLQQSILSK